MTTYVFRNGKLVDKKRSKTKFSTAAAPGVISDIMAETQHMATGRFHTSKSEFRKDTKAAGCVEIGNDAQALPKPRKIIPMDRGARREAIRQALYEARNK